MKPKPTNQETPMADRLRQLIRTSGLSLPAISRKCDIAQSALWRFVNDESKDLNLSTAEKLWTFFGLTFQHEDQR